MSNFLSFLSEVVIEEVPSKVKAERSASASRPKIQRNPEGDGWMIRVFKDGSIFPGQKFVDEAGLEYADRPILSQTTGGDGNPEYVFGEVTVGYGLDVINTTQWLQIKSPQPFIAVALVGKHEAKVDVFGSTKYQADGKPTGSVMEQGAATFGKTTLLPMLEEVYGIKPNAEGFIDLKLETGTNLKALSPSGVFLFPKVVARGEKKGQADFVRRENVDIFAIAPVEGHVNAPEVAEAPVTEPTQQDVNDVFSDGPTNEDVFSNRTEDVPGTTLQ